MAQQWHYLVNGQQHGPVSEAELKELVAAGKLQPADLVWKQGMSQWVAAGSVQELFPPVAVAVPVTPPPPPQPPPPPPKVQERGSALAKVKQGIQATGPLLGKVRQKLQSEETKARIQQAKGYWGRSPTWVKGGIVAGGLIVVLLFCVMPLRWFFGSSSNSGSFLSGGTGAARPSADAAGGASNSGGIRSGGTLTAAQLVKEYEDAVSAFMKPYAGKATVIRGTVAHDDWLRGEWEDDEGSDRDGVLCFWKDPRGRGYKAMRPEGFRDGQEVTLRGRLRPPRGNNGFVFDECELLGGGDANAAVTIRTLAQELKAKLAVVDARYKDKTIVVEGVIKKIELENRPFQENPVVDLEVSTTKDNGVTCVFSLSAKDVLASLQPGQKITAKGTGKGYQRSHVLLADCELLSPSARSHGQRGRQGSPVRAMTITEDFLPHKAGATAEYEVEMPGVGQAKHRISYETGGRINKTLVSIGGRFLNQHQAASRRVVRDGYVGEVADDGWLQCLKLGAKEGDTWERSGISYQADSFGTATLDYDKQQRTSLTLMTRSRVGDGAMAIRVVYVQGIGLLSKDGEGPAGRVRWALREQKKEWNLTRAERAFYE